MFNKFFLIMRLLLCLFFIFVNTKDINTNNDDSKSLILPINFERYKIIQTTLDEIGAFAPESLIKVITELTIDYEDIIVKNLVIDIAKESKEECIDQKICFRKLIQTMQKHDKNQKLTSKANQLAEVLLDDFSLNLSNNEPSKSSFSNSIAYLLKVKEDTLRNLPHKKLNTLKIEC